MSNPSAMDDARPRGTDLSAADLDALLINGAPDWERLPFDLCCPRCGYNLRGLPQTRCPECGLKFQWRPMLQRRLAGGDFLFEHCWRWQPIRSWLRTLLATFAPRRYWTRVTLYDPVRSGPLLVQLLLTIPVTLVALHAVSAAVVLLAVKVFGAAAWTGLGPPIWFWPRDASLAQLWRLARWPIAGDPRYLHLPASLLLCLFGAALVLFLMHQTFGRCRLRKAQILRVIAAVAGPVGAYVIVMLLVFALTKTSKLFTGIVPIYMEEHRLWRLPWWQWMTFFGGIAGYIWLLGSLLSRALSDYLRLPRARLVAGVAAFVGVLFSYTLMLFFGLLLSSRW